MSESFENVFDTTAEDEIIYSPYGIFGKRYIVPSHELWQKMMDWNLRSGFFFTICVVLAQIAIVRILHPLDLETELESTISIGVSILIAIIYLIRWHQINKKFVAGLKRTTVKYSLQEVVKKKSQSLSFLDIFMIEFVLLFFLVLTAYAGYVFPKGPYIGNRSTEILQIYIICFFVLCLILFVWFLYLLFLKFRTKK